jgi:hypothetical protein
MMSHVRVAPILVIDVSQAMLAFCVGVTQVCIPNKYFDCWLFVLLFIYLIVNIGSQADPRPPFIGGIMIGTLP